MALNTTCSSCLRGILVKQPIRSGQTSRALVSRQQSRTLSSARRCLASEIPERPPPPSDAPQPLTSSQQAQVINFASGLRAKRAFRSTTEPYVAYGGTEELFRKCAEQCDYTIPAVLKSPPEPPPRNAADEHIGEGKGWWYMSKAQGGFGLDVTFNTWAQVMMLHMWMLTARLRGFPKENVRIWHQNLLDHFFYAAEDRMVVWHGLSSRGSRNKYLKDLLSQWRGIILSYDEGIIKGDAVLATAVWRNIFKADENAHMRDLALVTAYIRRELQMLDVLPDPKLAAGEVDFSSPASLVKDFGALKA